MRIIRIIRLHGVLLLALVLSAFLAGVAAPPVLHIDFESNAVGPYTTELVKRDWGKVAWASLHDRAEIVLDEAASGKVLRMTYPAGSVGPGEGGGQFLVSLPPSEELWLSYRVKFAEGFDFRLGGKLPGLTGGGAKYTGGVIPREGEGWSARYMWGRGGSVSVYAYYVEMRGPWGQMFRLDSAPTMVPGQWHRITQRVKVNTPGEANGVLEVWFDAMRVFSRTDLRWRVGEKGRIDSLYFSTFHGGNTRDWAPAVDCVAYFDEFLVSKDAPEFVTAEAAPSN